MGGVLRLDMQRVWALLKLGALAATQILLEIGAFSGATALVAKLGPVPLSGYEIALNCASLTFDIQRENFNITIHAGEGQSDTSLFRPGTFFTCCAFTRNTSKPQVSRI